MKTMNGKKTISLFVQACLINFAIQAQFRGPLNSADYKTKIHYLYAQVTGLLGEYSFIWLLTFAVSLVFVIQVNRNSVMRSRESLVLPAFFAFCLLLGRSYRETGTWAYLTGDAFCSIRFFLAWLGFTCLFWYLLGLFQKLFRRAGQSEWQPKWCTRFFETNCFRNVFVLLLIVWLPIIVLSYPGNLCYDSIGQIGQGLGEAPYSTHHPLLHTLILSGTIRVISAVTGSRNLGLFCYILLQALALGAALAGTVARLTKRKTSITLRVIVTGIYVFAPMYSNMVSTAIKDIPFMAAVIWYLLLLEELLHEEKRWKQPLFMCKLVFVQALVGLLRNNGIYMVVLTGVGIGVAYLLQKQKKKLLLAMAVLAILPLLICKVGNGIMTNALSAEKGSVGEMFSLPFQQTARYLQFYGQELTEEEKIAIEGVLTDVNLVSEKYDPDIADPVKALCKKNVGIGSLAAYLKVWFQCFWKHPNVYLEAFFVHVYGWFDPGVSSAIRYEAYTDLFPKNGLFPDANKLLMFVYRFAAHVPFLEILENVGLYTWMLFVLAGQAIKKKWKKGYLLFPLFISLLICMASPCFYLHPRYAYPIMFTLPFLYGIMSTEKEDEGYEPDGQSAENM